MTNIHQYAEHMDYTLLSEKLYCPMDLLLGVLKSAHAILASLSCRCHVIGVCLPSQSASEKYNQKKKKPTYFWAPREFLSRSGQGTFLEDVQ